MGKTSGKPFCEGKRGTLSLTSGKSPSGIRQPSSFRQKNPSISPVTNQTSKTVAHSEIDSLPASTSIVAARPTRSLPSPWGEHFRHHSEINLLPVSSHQSQWDRLTPSNLSETNSLPVAARQTRSQHSHSSLSFLLPPSCGQPLPTLSLLFLGTFFLALTRYCFAANWFVLLITARPAVTARPTRSQLSHTNHSETNSLPAHSHTNHSETNSLPA